MEITSPEYIDKCNKCNPFNNPEEAEQLLKLAARYAQLLMQAKKKLEAYKQIETLIQTAADLANVVIETNSKKKEPKKKYGEFQNVLLTDKQYEGLTNDYSEAVRDQGIKEVDEYCELMGKKYSNYSMAVRKYISRSQATDKPKQEKKDDSHSYNLDLIMEHARNNSPGG